MNEQATVRELLREERRRELDRVPWSAWTRQVMDRLDAPLPHEAPAAAVELLRRDVEAEQTRFSERSLQFQEELEARIFSEGFGRRGGLRSWLQGPWEAIRSAPASGLTWAGAVAAAVLLGVFVAGGPTSTASSVSVDALSFEGSAFVVAEEGMTVVWLEDS